ncbi:serine--tRNA ligase [bacterium]|nr:serine--tRNA ligase [bacterium]MBU4560929.1 serine--tRNA ligase [bacterium]MCG2676708.1 serine--tRNA ligase [bacterium]MCG2677352.1 serine--tRNA ligase [bacterium]
MLDIKFIRENPEKVKEACRAKKEEVDIDRLLKLDKEYLGLLQKTEELRHKRRESSKKPPKKGVTAKYSKEELKKYEEETRKAKEERDRLLLEVPNLPAPDVKFGQSENDNEVIRTWGKKPDFDFEPLDYLVLAESLDLIDVKRAGKVSGTRFGYLKNEAVLLEFALVNFAFATLTKEGFSPVVPPVLINEDSMLGMGYLAHGGEEETYHLTKDGLYLTGTSEQSIGPMYKDEVLSGKKLPKRYVAFSSCFRREAGSWGKDTKGIFRVHQFDKIEMFSFTTRENSMKEHDYFLALEEKLVQALGIPYQVVKMCTSDLGNPAARKYDIECWIPSQGKHRETHSTSCCTDYQARRLNIKYKDKDGKKNFVHMVNGTAFAIGRTIIALIENFQEKDGSILIPKVLRPYMEGKKKITKHE